MLKAFAPRLFTATLVLALVGCSANPSIASSDPPSEASPEITTGAGAAAGTPDAVQSVVPAITACPPEAAEALVGLSSLNFVTTSPEELLGDDPIAALPLVRLSCFGAKNGEPHGFFGGDLSTLKGFGTELSALGFTAGDKFEGTDGYARMSWIREMPSTTISAITWGNAQGRGSFGSAADMLAPAFSEFAILYPYE